MIGDIRKFKFWCQKVLPLVYDDSLSYYEVLCKVVQYLNKVIEDVNSIPDYIDAVITERLSDEHLQELIEQFLVNMEKALSSNDEGTNTNSSADYNVGQMLWWKGELYRVIRKIDAGDALIADNNIELVSFDELLNEFMDDIKHNISANDDGASATATQNWTANTWVWLNDVLYKTKVDIAQGTAYVLSGVNANVEQITVEGELHSVENAITSEASIREEADDDLQTAIGDEVTARTTNEGDLSLLKTSAKTNLVSAINEVYDDVTENRFMVFDTVADMVEANPEVGKVCKTLGYYSANDGGGATYEIKENSAKVNIALTDGVAELIYDDTLYVKQLGGVEGEDIADILTSALGYVDIVIIDGDNYRIESEVTIADGKEVMGVFSGLTQNKLTVLTMTAGFIVKGRGNAIKNLRLVSDSPQAYTAIQCTISENSNHVNQCTFENLIIDEFNYAIYSTCVLWNNIFSNIRINMCNYGLYKNDNFDCFGNTFINFYASGSKHANILVNRFSATFINGIFGFSVLGAIRCTVNCNIEFIGCNFECDKHINDLLPDGYTSMIIASGGSFKFIGCLFAPNMESDNFVFQGGAGLRKASFECCYYNGSVGGNLSDAFVAQSAVPAGVYGAIEFDESCNSITEQITGTSHVLPNAYKPYVVYKYFNGLINIGNESSADTTKLSKGRIVYDTGASALKWFNGTSFVAV